MDKIDYHEFKNINILDTGLARRGSYFYNFLANNEALTLDRIFILDDNKQFKMRDIDNKSIPEIYGIIKLLRFKYLGEKTITIDDLSPTYTQEISAYNEQLIANFRRLGFCHKEIKTIVMAARECELLDNDPINIPTLLSNIENIKVLLSNRRPPVTLYEDKLILLEKLNIFKNYFAELRIINNVSESQPITNDEEQELLLELTLLQQRMSKITNRLITLQQERKEKNIKKLIGENNQ